MTTYRSRRVIAAAFVAFAMMLVALVCQIVSAEEPAASDLSREVLQPGDNYIGWVGEAIAVDDIFAAIPEAALIYTWDADSRVWLHAIRGVGGPLEKLEPGVAVTIRVFGDASVEWSRTLTPATGLVGLSTGVNWATWMGRDGWPLAEVARGIGRSLVSIEVDGVVYTAPIDAFDPELPAVRRGDALKVTVTRDSRWLQPTGIMPKLVWVGEIGQELKDEIAADIRHVLDYFAESLAVETDFADTAILIWKGVDAAVAYLMSGQEPRFHHRDPEALRAWLTDYGGTGGGTNWGAYVATCWWQPSCRYREDQGPRGLAHEWFHYLQIHISGRSWSVSPAWINEGAAMWGGDEGFTVASGKEAFDESREHARAVAARASATLKSAELNNGALQYDLGMLAIDLLVDRSDLDAPIEFLRLLYPQVVGPERRWQRAAGWHEAFEDAFDVSVDEFYTEFESWRATLLAPAERFDHHPEDRTLRGSLRRADGTPAAGFRINAAAYQGDILAGRERNTIVGEDGTFSIDLTLDTTQRIWVTHDACKLWLANDGLTMGDPDAGQFRDLDTNDLPAPDLMLAEDLSMLDLVLPEGACKHQVQVRILHLRGDDRRLEVGLAGDSSWSWGAQVGAGFTVFAPTAGDFQLMVRIGQSCDLWYRSGGLVVSYGEAESIRVDGVIQLADLRVPHDLCAHRISGRLVNPSDEELVDVRITARGDGVSGTAYSVSEGDFSIIVPTSGIYRLQLQSGGCSAYHGVRGPTSNWLEAAQIVVDAADVEGIVFRYRNLCE